MALMTAISQVIIINANIIIKKKIFFKKKLKNKKRGKEIYGTGSGQCMKLLIAGLKFCD